MNVKCPECGGMLMLKRFIRGKCVCLCLRADHEVTVSVPKKGKSKKLTEKEENNLSKRGTFSTKTKSVNWFFDPTKSKMNWFSEDDDK